jgi:hypothetical protein
MTNLYLYRVNNNHPDVMAQYNYIVEANSKEDAIAKMRNGDGEYNPRFCYVVSCTLIPSVESFCWYLPLNEATQLTAKTPA